MMSAEKKYHLRQNGVINTKDKYGVENTRGSWATGAWTKNYRSRSMEYWSTPPLPALRSRSIGVHWRITGAVTGPVTTNLPVTRVTGPVTRYGQVTGP